MSVCVCVCVCVLWTSKGSGRITQLGFVWKKYTYEV